jgi:DNA-binding NtrC family response regulator/tetratricopeptide (TPR) repeat protein
MAPLIFADRFIAERPGQALDLATGRTVWLRAVTPDGRVGRDQWLSRCAALSGLCHPNVVSLVDYGAIGRGGFFEAWGCPAVAAAWPCRDQATARAISAAVSFLMSRSLTPGTLTWEHVIDLAGKPVLLPDDDAGQLLDAGDGPALAACASDLERLLSACQPQGPRPHGLTSQLSRDDAQSESAGGDVRELVQRLEDVLDGGVSGRPRAVRFEVQAGTVDGALRSTLARSARLRGYVPIASAVLDLARGTEAGLADWRDTLVGRHILLLQPADPPFPAARVALFFLSLGLSSDRPHVLLRLADPTSDSCARGHLGVREKSTDYVTSVSSTVEREHPWPAAFPRPRGEIAARAEAIAAAAESGRHAQAERLLRDTMGNCARRRDDVAAGESALALGRLLLVRGQPAEAFRMLERARQHFDDACWTEGAIRAAVFAGLAWTDAGRLQEAEAALRAADIAAADVRALALRPFAALALARCLYWQERFAEAWERVTWSSRRLDPAAPASPEALTREWGRLGGATCARERLHGAPAAVSGLHLRWAVGAVSLEVARGCLGSRIALATGDVVRAGRLAAAARERAGESGNQTEIAAACYAKAAVFSALGDVSSVRAQVDDGIEAARHAHAPLRALRLRTVLAEALRRAGKEAEAGAVVARLARLDVARLPKVVGLPIERLLRGGPGPQPARSDVLVPALRAMPGNSTSSAALEDRPAVIETVVEVLGMCQSSEDEAAVLQRSTALLRERLHAASIACFGRDQDLVFALAADGGKSTPEHVARRAIESGLPIAPSSTTSGLEAAVPIRFAGSSVGAYACRWAADLPPDWPAAAAVLAASAAAVAPCVRTALDRRALAAEPPESAPGELVGVSDAVTRLRAEIGRAARAPFNVVVEGESGSGKELVARAIHRLGPRKHHPLCALNCAALADDLVEAELFGHTRGAFTGAVAERKGLFEEADHGTLVLDEVGELSARAQAKLLRAIQEGEVRRVGENFTRSVDVRIVAATNRSLRSAVDAGTFRCDLLYRLEVIRIAVPPLRERAEDIPVLAAHFWRQAAARVESRCTLAPETLAALARYDWPGNVRELQNVMSALAAAAGSRGSIGPGQLPSVIAGQGLAATAQNLDEARRTFEARYVRAALARAGGRRAVAADDLGLTRQGLAKLMARLGID